jgi:DNA-binding CsgD family transcriptional regulator
VSAPQPRPRPGQSLTVRQVEILHMIARGLTNERIGDRLGMHEEVVKGHVRELRAKLGAQDRASAVDQGWRRGYLGMWTVGVDWSTSQAERLVSGVRYMVRWES